MQRYDVIVAGMNFKTLAAAALMIASGKNVLIMTEAGSVAEASGAWDEQGYNFTPGPWCTFGLEPGGAVRRFFEEIGIIGFETAKPVEYHVALPDRRITVFRDHAAVIAELKREFPDNFDAIVAFYNKLSDEEVRIRRSGFRKFLAERQTSWRFVRKFGLCPEMLAFLDVQARFFFGSSLETLSLDKLMQICLTRPMALPGESKLSAAVVKTIQERGGEIRYHEKQAEILSRKSQIIGVTTAEGPVNARSILVSDCVSNPTVYFGTRIPALPVGMIGTVIYLPDYIRPTQVIALSSRDVPVSEKMHKSQDLSVVSVNVLGETKMHDDELIARCAEIIPFLREHIEVKRADSRAVPSQLVHGLNLKPITHERSDEPFLYSTTSRHMVLYRERSQALNQQILSIRVAAKAMT